MKALAYRENLFILFDGLAGLMGVAVAVGLVPTLYYYYYPTFLLIPPGSALFCLLPFALSCPFFPFSPFSPYFLLPLLHQKNFVSYVPTCVFNCCCYHQLEKGRKEGRWKPPFSPFFSLSSLCSRRSLLSLALLFFFSLLFLLAILFFSLSAAQCARENRWV
jgi:hypothetical protein